jgi:disulfide oxidoreductase YuzD
VETTRITESYLQMRYGQGIQVEYVDLADAEAQAQFSAVGAVIEERNLPFPLVAINGDLRLAGSAAYYHVLPLVEQALAVEGVDGEA